MARARPSSSRKRSKTRSPWRRRWSIAWKSLVVLALVALGALVTAVYVARAQLPSFEDLKSSPNGQMIRVHAADGSVIVSLGPSYGEWLPIDRIPAVMQRAMISVEDRRFYSHLGVDPIGVARSVDVRVRRGRWTQGGSTITQQLARNIFLTSAKKFGRKFREAILAFAIERKFSKDQILELYLNKVYFGGGAYGIDAASRKFFDHGAEDLELAEAAVIAGLVKAPSRYSPASNPKLAAERAKVVIGDRDAKAAHDAQAELKAKGYDADIALMDVTDSGRVSAVADELVRKYGKVDILVNNAGIQFRSPMLELGTADWQRVIDTNLTGLFNMTHPVWSGMRDRKFGRIINISSINGQKGQAGQANYSAAKAGDIGFVKALAQERLLDLVASVGQARKPVTTAPTAAERAAEQNARPARGGWEDGPIRSFRPRGCTVGR